MPRPHPALIELAAGRHLPPVDDMQAFLRSAVEHRMMGLVWRRSRSGDPSMTTDVQRDLATQSLLTEQRHRKLSTALAGAHDLLGDEGIDVATFKGVTAEQRWYDGVGDRPCWDVDLLVAPHSLHRAGDLVALLDPRRRDSARIQTLVDEGMLQTIDIVFEGVVMDIHFDLLKLGFRSRQPELVWGHTVEVPLLEGRTVRALDAEISFVFSLLHLNRDRFAKLLGFVEVLRIIERSDLDWEFIDSFVREEGLETPHALSLEVVLDTLGVDQPRPVRPAGWRTRIWNAAWPNEIRLLGEEGRLRFGRRGAMLLPFLVRGRSLDAARYVARRMFPRRAKLDLLHPNTEGPYLSRLVRARVAHRLQRRRERKALEALHNSKDGGLSR